MWNEAGRRAALLAGVFGAVIATFAAPSALVVLSMGDFAEDQTRLESYWGEELGTREEFISRQSEPSKRGGLPRLSSPPRERWVQVVEPVIERIRQEVGGRLYLTPDAVPPALAELVPALAERHGTAYVRAPGETRYLRVHHAAMPVGLDPAPPRRVIHPYRAWAPVALLAGVLAYRFLRGARPTRGAMHFPPGAYLPADVLGSALAALALAVPLYVADPPAALLTEPGLRGPVAMFAAMIASGVALVAYGASRAAYHLEVQPERLTEETLTGRREILLGQVETAEPVEVGAPWPVVLALAVLGVGFWPLFVLAALLRSTRCHGVRLHAPSGDLVVRTDLAGFEGVWKLLEERHLVTG